MAFIKKIILSLTFLLATPSSPSRTLEGLFELTRRPSRALDSPRALLPERKRKRGKDTGSKSLFWGAFGPPEDGLALLKFGLRIGVPSGPFLVSSTGDVG